MVDPVAVSHDPAVAERFRYDHLLLTAPERVWVTAVIRSRLSWVSGPLRAPCHAPTRHTDPLRTPNQPGLGTPKPRR
jgi:hypothetical protein